MTYRHVNVTAPVSKLLSADPEKFAKVIHKAIRKILKKGDGDDLLENWNKLKPKAKDELIALAVDLCAMMRDPDEFPPDGD